MAVFNEAYAVGERITPDSFPIRDSGGNAVFVCHILAPGADFTVTSRQYQDGRGTLISFSESLCARFEKDQDQYLLIPR
jgi:hypothetical protein